MNFDTFTCDDAAIEHFYGGESDAAALARRRGECAVAFDALGYRAGELAAQAGRIAPDPCYVAVLDASREAYRAHLDAQGDPEALCYAGGLRA